MRRTVVLALSALAISAAFACSSSTTSPNDAPDDGAAPDASTKSDAASSKSDGSTPGSDDGDAAPLKKQTESEPNDAKTAADLDPMDLPGEMTGRLDPEGDTDGFSLKVAPGDLWEWTLVPAADLTPNLVVFDTRKGTLNPVRLAAGAKGATVKLEQFVLRPGDFAAIVRDARNVDSSGSPVGGPTFGYTLTGKKTKLDGVAVTFPATKSGTLASLSSLDFFTFSGTEGLGFDIAVKAERKASPSTLDSRISLFNLTSKTTIITNDDAQGTTDSEIGGNLPATADYVLVVENEGTNDADLSYEVTFSLRE